MRALTHGAMLLAALVPVPAGAVAAPARIAALPDRFVLGRDANGEPCVAARNWRERRLGDVFDRAWLITCRGVAASRPQGYVLRLRDEARAAAIVAACGAAATQALAGIGAVTVRRCHDGALGFVATVVRFRRDGQSYIGAAAETATGPLEAMLRSAAGVAAPPGDRDAAARATLDTAALAAPPPLVAAPDAALAARTFDAGGSLQAGIALNHRGLYVEASRLLNDALSRLTGDAPVLTRAELELEAGLADSNISQTDAADDHFARATALLAGKDGGAGGGAGGAGALEAKRATYRGLDLLNRRQWRQALTVMADDAVAANPLADPAMLSRLNQPAAGDGARPTLSAALSAVDGAQFARLMLEAQRDWARSVASLALGETGPSRAALDRAAVYVGQLQRSVDPDALVALTSRIQRQYARVAAREGKIDQSLAYFDCALATLQAQPPVPGKPCPIEAPRRRGAGIADVAAGPLTAETQLERASVLARKPGVPRAQLLAAYDAGVDALIASNAASGVPAALEGYLDTLSQEQGDEPALAEQYFRAVQAVGEPAIARQLAQLQSVVTVDGALGAQVRDRAETERRIVQLRYQIAAAPPGDAAALAALENERRAAEDRLATLNAAVARDPRFRAVDDRPATIAQVRAALRPGEVYLKVSRLRTRAFATVIAADRSYVYPLAAAADDVDAIARRVRASIRDDSGRLPFFDVAASYALFRLVAGPAERALLTARAIVVDPSGAMQNLPAGVLVTDLASVRRHAAQGVGARNDYSQVAFLAAQAELSNALSPRSFLIARRLAESRAPLPFIGFGENAPPRALAGALEDKAVSFGTGCAMPYRQLAAIMSANQPVSAREIGIAATALGVPNAPEVTGAAFTDSAVMAASAAGDYARYQVVHFATHGLPETRSGCTVVPPSLVTTLAPPDDVRDYPSDGLLSFAEIARLRLDANLVVLSACETAAGVSTMSGRLGGQDESAATLDGLVRAFITANARAVLATYWKVPAIAETDRFFQTFYADGRQATIGAALKAAQTTVMRAPVYSHPYYWGAYFLVGDAGKTMLTPAPARVAAR